MGGYELQNKTMEELFKAYFSEGKCLSHKDVLLEVARRVGLEGAEAMLDSDEYSDEIIKQREMVSIDIKGCE